MKKADVQYSALATEEPLKTGLNGDHSEFLLKTSSLTGPNLDKAEKGLSFDSIFTYSAPYSASTTESRNKIWNQGNATDDGFAEYWRASDYRVTNDSRRASEGGTFESFYTLFLHPPFATSDGARRVNQSALISDSESIYKTLVKIGRQVAWTCIFIMFTAAWLILFPFHWYWTLSRVRLNEAVVLFRVGQPPTVRSNPGSVVCIWPLLDRLHRVSLARRGFSIPPTQIALSDGSVVRMGGEISFHVNDPLRFVRMASDTSTSIRHVVHGQFMTYLGGQNLDTLQRFLGGLQTELRSICFRHLSQFGVFVDTLVLSSPEVIKQPVDAGQELIRTVLQAIGGSGSQGGSPLASLSSVLSSAMPFMQAQQSSSSSSSSSPPSGNATASTLDETNSSAAGVETKVASKITQFISEAVRLITPEARASLNLSPDSMFRLTIGKHDSWLLFPYTGHVDGPVRPPQKGETTMAGYKERGCLYIDEWETLESLRDGNLSPLAATMSGRLSVSGDAAALAKLFDPSKLSM